MTFRSASFNASKVSQWVRSVIRATSSGVCFAPNRDQVGAGNKRRSGPIPTKLHRSNLALFDHVVSGSEQSLGDVQSERLSGFEIYHKLEFDWLLNRKFAWLFASQNTIHIRAQPLD